jgi:FkbM family methyltransferase
VCADSHEQAVVIDDEYGMIPLSKNDHDVKYIVDIGGNLGSFGVRARMSFPEAKIILCEPDPEVMGYAKENNPSDQMIFVEKAVVGTDDKEVTFNICDWAGNSHVNGHFRWDLFAPMGSKFNHAITVPAITLNELIDENNFPRIDILKIDCEGLEGEILQRFKPYMSVVRHFRGEWHGDADIPLIEDALKDTHNVHFDRKFTTHGDIVAELKPELLEAQNKLV